jgi:hypothetical protein
VSLTCQRTVLANGSDNDQGGFFYVPEFEMVLNRYQELKPDPTALEAFIKQQNDVVSQMKKVSIIMNEFVCT